MGLDETAYGTMRSNILAQDPLSSLKKIYLILVQEEHVKNVIGQGGSQSDCELCYSECRKKSW